MTYLVAFIVCFIAGIGAGLGTGFAGMSAAAVISPMLITFGDGPLHGRGHCAGQRRAGGVRFLPTPTAKAATWTLKTALS